MLYNKELIRKEYRMKRLNIAIFDMDNLKNPFWAAGQARATREVAKRLAKKHQITVYCAKYPGFKDYKADGITYTHIGIVNKSPVLTNLAFLFSIPLKVRKVQADVILENFNAPISISFAPIFTKVPVVGLPTMFNAKEFSQKYHLPFDLVEMIGFKFYKYLLPYSNTDSSKAKRLNPDIDFKIVPQGVDRSFFNIKHKKAKHILFLSRFDIWQKGLDLLLESYAKVAEKIKYPLVIAGHGPDEQKLRQLIKDLKIDDQVTIVGSAYGDKKTRLIQESIFVAFPSRHDEMSLWILEALASGLPIVAFDLPESRWISKGISLKAKPFDLDNYSKKLLEATQPALNKKMQKNAREFARGFTWEKVASEFEKYFIHVLEKEGKINL